MLPRMGQAPRCTRMNGRIRSAAVISKIQIILVKKGDPVSVKHCFCIHIPSYVPYFCCFLLHLKFRPVALLSQMVSPLGYKRCNRVVFITLHNNGIMAHAELKCI